MHYSTKKPTTNDELWITNYELCGFAAALTFASLSDSTGSSPIASVGGKPRKMQGLAPPLHPAKAQGALPQF